MATAPDITVGRNSEQSLRGAVTTSDDKMSVIYVGPQIGKVTLIITGGTARISASQTMLNGAALPTSGATDLPPCSIDVTPRMQGVNGLATWQIPVGSADGVTAVTVQAWAESA